MTEKKWMLHKLYYIIDSYINKDFHWFIDCCIYDTAS